MGKEITTLIILITSMMARSESIKYTDAEKVGFLFKNEYNQNNYCLTEPLKCVSETSSTNNEEYNYRRRTDYRPEISNEKLKQINLLLESWKRKAEATYKPTKNKILVLGNSGVGISTFVQFIAGNNSKLISEEAGIGNGEFLIKDDDKIGTSLKESFTIYPEEVTLNENTTVCDIPGFSNSRNLTEEILVSYNKEKYFKNMNEYSDNKVVILTEYYSVQNGIFKRNFINLLENIYNHYYNLIHERYYEMHFKNFVLIVVKVPNIYESRNSRKHVIPDRIVIINIANYIKKIKVFLTESLKKQINCDERNFFNFAITLIDSLLDEDVNGNYKKINIFRQPEEPGNLSEMKLFQDNKISLMETILNKTDDTYSSTFYIRHDRSNGPNKLKCLSQRFEKFKTCIKESVTINMEKTLNELKSIIPEYNIPLEDHRYNAFDATYKKIEMMNNDINTLYKLKYHFN